MIVVTASEVKNRLGDLFDATERDPAASVLVERSRRPVAMLLNARIAERALLAAYAHGALSRGMVMQQLGIDWYGELLRRLEAEALRPPQLSVEDQAAMAEVASAVFDAVAPTGQKTTRRRARSQE